MKSKYFDGLKERTLRASDDVQAMKNAEMLVFVKAVAYLAVAGLSEEQIQWMIGEPFSEFGSEEFATVLIMALALERGTATVDEWYDQLRERELAMRIWGMSMLFVTETLPSMEEIDEDLGIPPARAQRRQENRIAPRVTTARTLCLPAQDEIVLLPARKGRLDA